MSAESSESSTTPPAVANDRRVDPLTEPALFWFWNQTPTPDSIRTQLDAFARQGVRAVYIHPMPAMFRPACFHAGMDVPYLSESFFHLVALTCEALAQRGMWLWLYDEGGWPSGMAGGAVVAENPAFGAWTLRRQADGRVTPTQHRDEVAYPDLMNSAATACFIRHTHDGYRRHLGHAFGRTVLGIFTDEARILGRVGTDEVPWSPRLPEAFEADHGRPFASVVKRLFATAPPDEDTHHVRRQYLHTVSRLIAASYYAPLRAWCDKHGLHFEGHHAGEDAYARHGQYFGHYLEQARHYTIPGVDTIWRQIFPGQAGGHFVALASSAAWLSGRRHAVSESFAVYGPGLTPAQMHWVLSFQLVRGITQHGLMATLESAVDARRIATCSDIAPRDPRWIAVADLFAFVRRTASVVAAGQADPRVAIFYRSELAPEARAEAYDREHERLCRRILDDLNMPLFVDMKALHAAEITGAGMRLQNMTLQVLVVHPATPLDAEEVRAIAAAASRGLRVIYVGDDAGWQSLLRGARKFVATSRLERADDVTAVDTAAESPVQLMKPVPGVRLLVLRRANDMDLLFFNENGAPVELAVCLREHPPAELREVPVDDGALPWLDPPHRCETGHRLRLHAGQLRVLRVDFEQHAPPPKLWQAVESQGLVDGWERAVLRRYVIRRDVEIEAGEGRFTPTALGDFNDLDPTFSGTLCYRRRLWVNALGHAARLVVDLGTVYYHAEVLVNGQLVGRRAWAPMRFDLTDALKTGDNELLIRVTNTLANQWLRPDIHHRDRNMWDNVYLDKVTPFMSESRHAGLVGPVTLRCYAPSAASCPGSSDTERKAYQAAEPLD